MPIYPNEFFLGGAEYLQLLEAFKASMENLRGRRRKPLMVGYAALLVDLARDIEEGSRSEAYNFWLVMGDLCLVHFSFAFLFVFVIHSP